MKKLENMLFKDVVRKRKSCRGFLSKSVEDSIINEVLEAAVFLRASASLRSTTTDIT